MVRYHRVRHSCTSSHNCSGNCCSRNLDCCRTESSLQSNILGVYIINFRLFTKHKSYQNILALNKKRAKFNFGRFQGTNLTGWPLHEESPLESTANLFILQLPWQRLDRAHYRIYSKCLLLNQFVAEVPIQTLPQLASHCPALHPGYQSVFEGVSDRLFSCLQSTSRLHTSMQKNLALLPRRKWRTKIWDEQRQANQFYHVMNHWRQRPVRRWFFGKKDSVRYENSRFNLNKSIILAFWAATYWTQTDNLNLQILGKIADLLKFIEWLLPL